VGNIRKFSWGILLLIGLISAGFASLLPDISFDYDLDKFIPLNHPETKFFRDFQQEFENDNNYVLIGIRNPTGIFNLPFLKKIDSLTKVVSEIQHVTKVHSPTNVKRFKRVPLYNRLSELPYLHPLAPDRYPSDSIRIYQAPHLENRIFSSDRQSVVLYVEHDDPLTTQQYQTLASRIEAETRRFEFHEVHFAGKSFAQTSFIEIIEREVVLFIGSAVLLITLFLLIAYRSFWGLVIPLSIVGLSVVWTLGIMVSLGYSIDLISNIIPTILLIIGIADAVHLLTNYLMRIQSGEEKRSALKAAIREVVIATFLTTFTTSIGFLTLTTSNFSSLVSFGIFSTVGIAIAYLLTYSLMPAILVITGAKSFKYQQSAGFWDRMLEKGFLWVQEHPNLIWLSSLAIVLFGIIGLSQIQVNNFLLQDLPEDHPQQVDLRFFSENFAGARSFEMVVNLKTDQETVFQLSHLKAFRQIDSFLQNSYGVDNILSPSKIIQHAHMVYQGGNPNFFRLPQDTQLVAFLSRKLDEYAEGRDHTAYFSNDERVGRFSGKIGDLGSVRLKKFGFPP
jgi:hypothetical protein